MPKLGILNRGNTSVPLILYPFWYTFSRSGNYHFREGPVCVVSFCYFSDHFVRAYFGVPYLDMLVPLSGKYSVPPVYFAFKDLGRPYSREEKVLFAYLVPTCSLKKEQSVLFREKKER